MSMVYMYICTPLVLICRLISPCAVVWSSQLQWPCSSSALLAWSSIWLLALTEYVFLSQASVVWSIDQSVRVTFSTGDCHVCLSVYISVCLHISKPDIQTSHKISHMCYHGPWIGLPLMKMENVILPYLWITPCFPIMVPMACMSISIWVPCWTK